MIALLVFFIPWGARLLFTDGMVNGMPVEALTRSLFAVEALVFIMAGVSLVRGPRPLPIPRRAGLLLLALLLWVFASGVWSPSPDLALQAGVRILAAALFFLLLLRERDLGRCRDAFLLAAALQAALGLWQVLSQEVGASTLLGVAAQHPFAASAVIESAAGRMLRAYGTFPHPNVLGGFLAAALILALADRRQGRAALWISGAVPLFAAGLLASFSRSAWLAAVAGAIVLLVLSRHESRRLALRLSAVGVAVVVFAVLAHPFLFARLTANGRLEQRSIDERQLAFQQARFLVRDAPLQGVGIGQTVPALLALGGEIPPLLEPPHAAPAVLIVELGIIGFILAIAFAMQLVPRRAVFSPEAVALAAAHLPLSFLDHYLVTTVPGLLLAAFTLALFLRERRS